MKKSKSLTFAVIIISILAGFAPAADIVVDINGGYDHTNISAAITASVNGDIIIVRPGTYLENINMSGKAITLRSTDPTDPAVVTATIIDGNASGSVITCDSSETSATVISGFVITNGSGTLTDIDGLGRLYKCGGGMYNLSSSPTVTNCTFSGNTATGQGGQGGGMFNYNSSSPTVTNCTFSGNTATYGGGMYNQSSSSPTVTNCIFSQNTVSAVGGGMCNNSSSPTVTNCTFSGNTATGQGGGMFNYNSSSPTVTNCTFSGNTADHGGGMYNLSSSPTVTNCTFIGNTAGNGGGMYNLSSSPTVTNCTFSGNTAGGYGGGMVNYDSSTTVRYCRFSGNSVISTGGGMHNHNSNSATVTNCTFSDNMAGYEGGGMAEINDSGTFPVTLENTYFCGNGPQLSGNFQGTYSVGTCQQGDLDWDGDVDLADFAILAANWLVGVE